MTRFKLRLCWVGGEWWKVTRQEVTSKYRETASCCVLWLPLAPPNEFVQGSFETSFVSNDFSLLVCLPFSRDNEFSLIYRVFEIRGSRRSKDRCEILLENNMFDEAAINQFFDRLRRGGRMVIRIN